MSDTTIGAAPVTPWRPVPPDRRPADRSPDFTAGPPALTVGIYTQGDREVARGYLTVAAARHFQEMGCDYLLAEYGEDERGGLLRLVGLPSKSSPLAMRIGNATVIATQLRRLAGPEGKHRYQLARIGAALVARIPEEIMQGLRSA
ncbi:MAG TPA: hypothetical protein VNL16_07370 [Chloroflexota bacterium]|nr:hypothetical protein [Chloroflexota bacterium]